MIKLQNVNCTHFDLFSRRSRLPTYLIVWSCIYYVGPVPTFIVLQAYYLGLSPIQLTKFQSQIYALLILITLIGWKYFTANQSAETRVA